MSAGAGQLLPGESERGVIARAESLDALARIPDSSVDLIYIDPPFNTGRMQSLTRLRTTRAEEGAGDRVGFAGRVYTTTRGATLSFQDTFEDYPGFLRPRLEEARRVMARSASIYVHLDQREAHYVKALMDELFGREAFLNEIIWAYDFGGRSQRRWAAKHDTILLYARTPGAHYFDADEVERIPYMAPGLVTKGKAARGKLPTDVWWHTIVPTNGAERTGYPTQKPLGVLRRIISASCPKGGVTLDFFAGSGTTGAACLELGRRFALVDRNPEAIDVMRERFAEEQRLRWVDRGAPATARPYAHAKP